MNVFNQVESALKAYMETIPGLSSAVKEIHAGLKSLEEYPALPAVAVKVTDINRDPDDGEETVEGFFEVVSVGDYKQATDSSENIASMIYVHLSKCGGRIPDSVPLINEIEVKKMQLFTGEINTTYAGVVHVYWACSI